MKCERCDQKAISTKPSLCSEHFDSYILDSVAQTIQDYDLFSKEQTICVGVSGGKDSLALLDVLTRLGYHVEGLFINEGIANYREFSIEDLDAYMQRSGIRVRKVSFKEEAGFKLDEAMSTKQFHACSICGTLRRHLLNKYAQGYDVIATGHNMDDESQTVLMNLAKGNVSLFMRTGPKTLKNKDFVPRVKPFYFVSEKHILTYCVMHTIKTDFSECPYAGNAYRMRVTEVLNSYEEEHPGTKRNILETYLQLREDFVEAQQEFVQEELDHTQSNKVASASKEETASDIDVKPNKVQQVIDEVQALL